MNDTQLSLLTDKERLIARATRTLYENYRAESFFFENMPVHSVPSSVLFLLGFPCGKDLEKHVENEPCLILNKRSQLVKQPGDLCCPGGSVSKKLDGLLSRFLNLPGSSFFRWKYYQDLRKTRPDISRWLSVLFAAGLREGFEEMRLNPFSVNFLGPLPPNRLISFQRWIYPMAAWISSPGKFRPNWEVEKIVSVPLRTLLDPNQYFRYRLTFKEETENRFHNRTQDFPCFVSMDAGGKELLWGATYRIVMNFLRMVFGFEPPDPSGLPIVNGELDNTYLTGSG